MEPINTLEVFELLLAGLGFFSIIARFTPTKKDDAILDSIKTVVHGLGLTKPEALKSNNNR